jgi:hypothetical protein
MSGRMFMLATGLYRVGKAPRDITGGGKPIVITGDRFISKDHATLKVEGDTVVLDDPGSTNGTFVNGEKVNHAVLKSGDEVRFGETVFRITMVGS